MMKKQTAWNWVVSDEQGKNIFGDAVCVDILDENGLQIATVHYENKTSQDVQDIVRLISAAPKLLKALDLLFCADVQFCISLDGKSDQIRAFNNAVDAYEQATGGKRDYTEKMEEWS